MNGRSTALSGALAAQPAISSDGRWVAFTAAPRPPSSSSRRSPRTRYRQVSVRDRRTSPRSWWLRPAGTQGLGHSLTPAISGNGAVVAFASAAGDLVADDANQQDRRVRLVELDGAVEIISRSTAARPGTPASGFPASTGTAAGGLRLRRHDLVPGDATGGPAAPLPVSVTLRPRPRPTRPRRR